MSKIIDRNRVINLTSLEELPGDKFPKHILMLNQVNQFMCKVLAKFQNTRTLNAFTASIQTMVNAEESMYENGITVNDVVLVVNKDKCDEKAIVALNASYHSADVSHLEPLEYFNSIREFGETLQFPDYDFFKLITKCLFTLNTRIGPLYSDQALMNETEYYNQDFLMLVKVLLKEKRFSLEIENFAHEIILTEDGLISVDGKYIINVTEAQSCSTLVIVEMYKTQPNMMS